MMKKKLLFVMGAFALLGGSAIAQDISFGPKAGLNYTIITTNFKEGDKPDDWENSSGIGWHIGGYLNYGLSDNLAIRPELLISSRGVQSTSTTETDLLGVQIKTEVDAKNSNTFVEVPVLLALGNQESGIQLHVGPSFNLLASAKSKATVKTTVDGDTTEETVEVSGSDAKEGQRGLDLGLCAGLLFQTEGGFNVGLRYQRGLTSINDENTDSYASNYNVIQFSLGFTLGN